MPNPTAAELKAQADAARETARNAKSLAEELSAKARKAEREERQAKERDEKEAHQASMFAEIGQPLAGLNEAQHAIVWEQAWSDGHSSGFEQVEYHYGQYAEMIRKVLDAN